jgi:hypothetical protein
MLPGQKIFALLVLCLQLEITPQNAGSWSILKSNTPAEYAENLSTYQEPFQFSTLKQ